MFSFLPFPQAIPREQVLSFATGSSKLLVPGRVTASSSIPQGAVSLPVNPDALRGHSDVVQVGAYVLFDHNF